VPAFLSFNDPSAVEVGSNSPLISLATSLCAFYKGSANTGTHIGNLWTARYPAGYCHVYRGDSFRLAAGQLLTPVAITANTVYVLLSHCVADTPWTGLLLRPPASTMRRCTAEGWSERRQRGVPTRRERIPTNTFSIRQLLGRHSLNLR